MITKAEAINIVEKFEFFQGQRAGRELWLSKSRWTQEDDLDNFCQNCRELLEYIKNTEIICNDNV